MDNEVDDSMEEWKRQWPFYFIGFAIIVCLILMLSTLKYHTKQMEQPFHTVTYEINHLDMQDKADVKMKTSHSSKHIPNIISSSTVTSDLVTEDTSTIRKSFVDVKQQLTDQGKELDLQHNSDNVIYSRVDEMPLFFGGNIDKFHEWIERNLMYPVVAAENGIVGKVSVGFNIDSNGNVCNVEVVRGVDPYLDQEAVRVIKSSPLWTPGKLKGKPVKVHYDIQVDFELN